MVSETILVTPPYDPTGKWSRSLQKSAEVCTSRGVQTLLDRLQGLLEEIKSASLQVCSNRIITAVCTENGLGDHFRYIHRDRKYQKCPGRTFLIRFDLPDHSWSLLKYAPK